MSTSLRHPDGRQQPSLNQALADYRAGFSTTWTEDTPVQALRFVALDCETTGMDPRHHGIVSIGAVGVTNGRIELGDTFEVLLWVRHNTATTPVHGITRSEARAGLDEAVAMARLLPYLKDGIIVGHHIAYDIAMIDAMLRRRGGTPLINRRLDIARLAMLLEADGAFVDQGPLDDLSLDGLCRRFDIVPHDRHTAAGDAFLAAQVLLRLLRIAARCGRTALGALLEPPPGE